MSSFHFQLRPKSRARHLGGWWILGLALGGLASAFAILFYRTKWRFLPAGEGMSEAGPIAMPAVSGTAATPELEPMPAHVASGGVPETEEWMSGGKGMDTLVPASYAVPDSAAAMQLEETFDRNMTSDAPPVGSVYSDPAPEAGTPEQPDPTGPHAAIVDSGEGTEAEPWLGALRLALEKSPREMGYDRAAWTGPLLGRYLLDTQGVSIPLPRLRGAIKDLGYQWQHTHYVQTRPALR